MKYLTPIWFFEWSTSANHRKYCTLAAWFLRGSSVGLFRGWRPSTTKQRMRRIWQRCTNDQRGYNHPRFALACCLANFATNKPFQTHHYCWRVKRKQRGVSFISVFSSWWLGPCVFNLNRRRREPSLQCGNRYILCKIKSAKSGHR